VIGRRAYTSQALNVTPMPYLSVTYSGHGNQPPEAAPVSAQMPHRSMLNVR
jgi:hypothetical protein